MSLRTFLLSTILASTAIATSHDSWGGDSWGGQGGGSHGGGKDWTPSSDSYSSGGQGWSTWEKKPPAPGPPVAAPIATCPVGCIPIPTGAPPPQQTKPGEIIVQVVAVGDKNASLKYFPNQVHAPVGSVVQFQFFPKNHTITESSFADPCKPLAADLTSDIRPGIRSGFIPVTGSEPFTPVYNVLVNDTKPIWLYCGQTNHCQRGMAMVINPPKDSPNTIEKYIENAGKIPLVNPPAPPPAPPAATGPPSPPPGPPGPPSPPGPPPSGDSGSDNPFGAPPAASSTVAAPPVQTLGSSTVPIAPATFTGAGSQLNARDMSFGAVVIGAVVALL